MISIILNINLELNESRVYHFQTFFKWKNDENSKNTINKILMISMCLRFLIIYIEKLIFLLKYDFVFHIIYISPYNEYKHLLIFISPQIIINE